MGQNSKDQLPLFIYPLGADPAVTIHQGSKPRCRCGGCSLGEQPCCEGRRQAHWRIWGGSVNWQSWGGHSVSYLQLKICPVYLQDRVCLLRKDVFTGALFVTGQFKTRRN